MNFRLMSGIGDAKDLDKRANRTVKFSFGMGHRTKRGPLRLLIPQNCFIAPAFDTEGQRGKGLLRVLSSYV
nr:hypothetical protein Hi04_10k_c5218_00027 [uncultured bacterium]